MQNTVEKSSASWPSDSDEKFSSASKVRACAERKIMRRKLLDIYYASFRREKVLRKLLGSKDWMEGNVHG